MDINPDELRCKSYLSEQEIRQLGKLSIDALRMAGVRYPFSDDEFDKFLMYAVRHEVGGLSRGGEFPTNLGNGTFAGVLQTGVDVLIEGNAATRDFTFKARRPSMWTMFPSGIAREYTRSNRAIARQLHASFAKYPRNVFATATDNLVSITNYLDTCLWAYKVLEKSFKRTPSVQEVYAFHVHGYPLLTNYYYLKGGLKPFNRGMTLEKVTSQVKKQLSMQSAQVRKDLGEIGLV